MKKYRNIGQIVIFTICLVAFLFVIHEFVIPVLFGLLVSLVFRPVYRWIRKHLGNRHRLAAGISTFLVFCCVLVPMILVGFYVLKDFVHFAKDVSGVSVNEDEQAFDLQKAPNLQSIYQAVNKIYPISPEQFQENIAKAQASLGQWAKNVVSGRLGSIARVVTSSIFFLIAFYFGLVDGARLLRFIRENSPFSVRETEQIFKTTIGICNAVVLASLLAGLVQGTIIGIAYSALGIPKPLFFGALTVLFGFIPLVGSAPMGIGGTLYLLFTGHPVKAIIMLGAFGLAGISDNIVKPMVLKGRMSLHPFLGLLSVLGGIKAFGLAGIFLGPVITALTITLLQLLHHRVKTLRETSQQATADEVS